MVVTNDIELPTYEELTVEEVPISSPGLRAAAHHIGKYCLDVNDEFMMCKQETNDPRKCLNEGKAVTSCALEFFRKLKGNCFDEFQIYSNCIDKSSSRMDFEPCRKTQAVYDKCVFEKMGIERPEHGFFCKARVYTGNRPKPPVQEPQVFGELPVGLKDFKEEERPPAKYGQRNWFIK
ncbi:PREDICTED: NADH dehydrogenase [ubiquinone] 1 alpha subcomplex subunit 8 [Diuraphis noxia]|uniref:NADH dehydrogenase [ubiquinone] 1 alpha subcomplex subunit 8 n=1 Tax=Diuraphis noxia TaxID=143948 RepID=UPI000763A0F8|nr:PREDICTED: NADH dehydrogenase [ubiquinone] 1 alpha subcomplex subunit 8 [Diuraphis noxia]